MPALALLVTFFSASQDIVLDAYRREILPDNELGLGSSFYINGYRIGMLVAGAGAFIVADNFSWKTTYVVMAFFMAVGIITTLFSAEPKATEQVPSSIKSAIIDPFREYFNRDAAILVLAFILLYKIGDQMAANMTTPFILKMGFTKTEYATIVKSFGLFATITGGLIGGIIILKSGIIRTLWIFGILQAGSHSRVCLACH